MPAKKAPPSTGDVPTKEARREHQDGKVVTVPAPPPLPHRPTREQVDAAKVGEVRLKVTADTSDATSELGKINPKWAPGETTTEFALTALGAVAATVLACFGKIDGTAALAAITAAVTGYSVSRGLAKR